MEMKVSEVFIDLDGVCANFDRHVLDRFDIGIPEGESSKVGMPGQKCFPLPWEKMDHDFWATIPLMPMAKDGIIMVEKFVAPAYFLSGATRFPGSYSGKFAWLAKLIGEEEANKRLILCNSEQKKLLSRPGRILIDDRIRSINEWREAGGHGILFGDPAYPSQWIGAIKQLREIIEDSYSEKG